MRRPRLLLRLPNWLGDVIMAQPVVLAMAARHGAALTVVGAERWLSLLRPDLGDEVSLVTPDELHLGLLREHAGALLLDGSLRTAVRARLAGIPCVVSLASGGRGLISSQSVVGSLVGGRAALPIGARRRGLRRAPRPFGAVAAELCSSLPRELTAVAASSRPRLEAPSEAQAACRQSLAKLGLREREYILLNAGARPGSTKGMPAATLQAMLDELEIAGAPVLVVVGPGEEQRLEGVRLTQGCQPLSEPPDLLGLAALAASCDFAITADGGGRHLIRAAGARCLTIFGPTDPRHSLGPGPLELRLTAPVRCGPCHQERCGLESTANRGSAHLSLPCFDAVGPDAIRRAIRHLMLS